MRRGHAPDEEQLVASDISSIDKKLLFARRPAVSKYLSRAWTFMLDFPTFVLLKIAQPEFRDGDPMGLQRLNNQLALASDSSKVSLRWNRNYAANSMGYRDQARNVQGEFAELIAPGR